MIELGATLRPRAAVRYRVIEGQAVIIVQDRREAIVLDEVGTRILELTDGATPVEAVVARLEAEYDVERGRLEADVVHHLGELESLGIVETIEPAR